MPVVTGLFSEVELHSSSAPSIEVTTRTHGTRPSIQQIIGWLIGGVAAFAALVLIATEGLNRRPGALAASIFRQPLKRWHVADTAVAVTLLVWLVIAPALWDDGWILARQSEFSTSGGFSNYYNALAGNLPNGYWLEWVQHWVTESSRSLVVLRLPALICLYAIWMLGRWIVARVWAPPNRFGGIPIWSLAFGFLTCALAWGMTLRPEPFVALIVTAVLAATFRFLEVESAAPLVLITVLVPLAGTAHHTGVLAAAPLIVIAPRLLSYARVHLPIVTALAMTGIGLVMLLAFVGSDIGGRADDAEVARTFGDVPQNWRDEFDRYALLTDFPYGAPLRRASVALIALALLAFVLRRRRHPSTVDLPSNCLTISLLLLVLTPSKWPWHFGALIGLTALAGAFESARRRERTTTGGSVARSLIVVGAAVVAAAWSWTPRIPWSAVDLRTLDWQLGLEQVLPLSKLAIVLPILALLAAVLRRPARGPGLVASLSVPMLTIPLLAFTLGVILTDTARTASWTLGRQNLESIRGESGCGLADDLDIPIRRSMRPVSTFDTQRQSLSRWLPPKPIPGIRVFALGPAGDEPVHSPWFVLPRKHRLGLFVSGKASSTDVLMLDWARLRARNPELIGESRVSVAFAHEVQSVMPWRFVSARELPDPPRDATLVRVSLSSETFQPATLGVTTPMTYRTEPLAALIGAPQSRALILPSVFTYFPCAKLPRLSNGMVDDPTQIVVRSTASSPIEFPRTSPFSGVLDLHTLERLPFADSLNPPEDLVVFGIDQRIPGAVKLPPDHLTRTD